MIAQIAYYYIGRFPLVAVIGMITYALFIATALIPILTKRGIIRISLKWHWRLAYAAIGLATVHGLMILLSSLGY